MLPMNKKPNHHSRHSKWRDRLYIIIFESHTPGGKIFDIFLLIFILLSIFTIMLESVESINQQYRPLLLGLEWFFTLIFTFEYIFRIYSARSRKAYIFSFYGIVDLLSILPTFLSYILLGSQYLLVIRGLRLLRIFRVLKMARFLGEAETLKNALINSVAKITVFIGAVLTVIIIVASCMYLIEGPEGGFNSIPLSIYWAIVTITTVGYGDIVPATNAGKALATLLMLLGYGIIAVPTGIVSAELTRAEKDKNPLTTACPRCNPEDHSPDSSFCRFCGARLNITNSPQKETEKK
jgi:voltage-gated potassium channel